MGEQKQQRTKWQERNERLKKSVRRVTQYARDIYEMGPVMAPIGRAVRFVGSHLYAVRNDLGQLEGRVAQVETTVKTQGKTLESIQTTVDNVPTVASNAAQRAVDGVLNQTSPETAEVHRFLTTEVEVEGKKLSGLELIRKAFATFPPIVRKWFESFEAKGKVQDEKPQATEVDPELLRKIVQEELPKLVAQLTGKEEKPAAEKAAASQAQAGPEQDEEPEAEEEGPEAEEAAAEAKVVPLRAVPVPAEQEQEAEAQDTEEADAGPEADGEQADSAQQWDMEPVDTIDAQEEEDQESGQEILADVAELEEFVVKLIKDELGEKIKLDSTASPEERVKKLEGFLLAYYEALEMNESFDSEATLKERVEVLKVHMETIKETTKPEGDD